MEGNLVKARLLDHNGRTVLRMADRRPVYDGIPVKDQCSSGCSGLRGRRVS